MSQRQSAPVFIQLGLPKTATTTIRFNLFARHSQVYYLGKFLGGGFPQAVRSALVDKSGEIKMFDEGDIHQASINEQLVYASENHLKPVLAEEGLAAGFLWNKRRQARLFQNSFGNCKAILFIREPTSFLKSFYVQMLRNFNQGSPGKDPYWMCLLGKPPRYFDINQWMTLASYIGGVPQGYIRYADTATAYANVFGIENVRIFIFEEFIRHPKAFIQSLCEFIGIDETEGFELICKKRSNERLTTAYIENIHNTERSSVLRKAYRKASQEERRRLLIPENFDGERINPVLSKKWVDKIDRLSRKQNRRLAANWNLPVEDYGYKI